MDNIYKYISKTAILTLISAFLLELYIVGVEQSNYFALNGYLEIFRFFSLKHILLFAALFFLVYAILFKEDLREKTFEMLYKYRFLIGALIIIISVILEIHGSSIGQLNISNITHNHYLEYQEKSDQTNSM